MGDSSTWDRAERALDRLASGIEAGDETLDAVRAGLFDLAAQLEGEGDSCAVPDGLRLLASTLAPGNVEDVLGAARELMTQHEETPLAMPVVDELLNAPADVPPDASPDAPDDVAAYLSDPEMGAMFVAEGLDHLATIESVVLQLEATPDDPKLLSDVFRPFHTVKGNAGVLGLMSIQELAHKMETLLDLARSGQHVLGPGEVDVVLRAVDLLTLMIRELPARAAGHLGTDVSRRRRELVGTVDALIAGGHSSAVPHAAAVVTEAGPGPFRERREDAQSTVKVNTRKLDALLDMVGELVIAQSILAEDPVLVRSHDERLNDRLGQLKRITSDLQRSAMAMRMVPIRQTFQKMSRLVRDLGRQSDKPISLVLSGEETELDRRVVEHLTDPLMHMIRNCIDHGIEGAAERAAAGKPVTAELRLSACHRAGSIVVEVADDGAGLNTAKIRQTAIAKGLLDESAELSAADVHQLIFHAGFSTAERVTEISGRGVGMDVVRRNVEALRGRIEIQTSPGRGTTFIVRLPLTLAIVDGLVLSVGAERFVIPTFAVRESLRPLPEQVHTLQGQPRMVSVRERLIPLLNLGEVFAIAGARRQIVDSTVVIVEDGDRPVALVVDELLGKYEVVIKSLGEAFGNVRGVAGGAILGDGRIGLILDAGGLLSLVGTEVVGTAA